MRTHSESELAHLEQAGVGMVVMGERELALGMVDYALHSLASVRTDMAGGSGAAEPGGQARPEFGEHP